MQTVSRTFVKNLKPRWHHVDAKGMIVGRLAVEVAKVLQGRNKAVFDPSADCGDYVVVTNARHVVFTGKQWKQKLYRWHTGHPGGLRSMPAWRLLEKSPEKVLKKAVWGMLPKNKLRYPRIGRLKIFADEETKHTAQMARALPLRVPEHVLEKEEIPYVPGYEVELSLHGDRMEGEIVRTFERPAVLRRKERKAAKKAAKEPFRKSLSDVPHQEKFVPEGGIKGLGDRQFPPVYLPPLEEDAPADPKAKGKGKGKGKQ